MTAEQNKHLLEVIATLSTAETPTALARATAAMSAEGRAYIEAVVSQLLSTADPQSTRDLNEVLVVMNDYETYLQGFQDLGFRAKVNHHLESAHDLGERYDETGKSETLNEALNQLRAVIDHPDFGQVTCEVRLASWSRLGQFYQARYLEKQAFDDLRLALKYLVKALAHTPPYWQHHADRLNNLAVALINLGQRQAKVRHFRKAIRLIKLAIERFGPHNQITHGQALLNLGNAHYRLYGLTGNEEDLAAALVSYQNATAQEPGPATHNGVAVAMRELYWVSGRHAYLDGASSAAQAGLDSANTGGAVLSSAQVLNTLGLLLLDRFDYWGNRDELELAIDVFEKARAGFPVESAGHRLASINLARAYRETFTYYGETESLAKARTYGPSNFNGDMMIALESSSASSRLLLMTYETEGDHQSLEKAVTEIGQMIESLPPTAPDRCVYRNNLALTYRNRFQASGRIADLEKAVNILKDTLSSMNQYPARQRMVKTNLATSLLLMHQRFNKPELLPDALAMSEDVLRTVPPKSPLLAIYLHNSAHILDELWAVGNKREHLEKGIARARRAVRSSTENSPALPARLSLLATTLLARYRFFRNIDDLRSAESHCRRACELCSDRAADKAIYLNNLGLILRERGLLDQDEAALTLAMTTWHKAGLLGLKQSPHMALKAARFQIELAFERGDDDLVMNAWNIFDQAVQHLTQTQMFREDKESWLVESQGVVGPVAFALARMGKAKRAVEVLDRGLARLFNEALLRQFTASTMWADPESKHLSERCEEAVSLWRALTHGPKGEAGVQETYRRVVDAFAEVERHIPSMVRPLSFSEIAQVSPGRLLAYILATDCGGLILLIVEGEVQPVWLPDFSTQALQSVLWDEQTGYIPAYMANKANPGLNRVSFKAALERLTQFLERAVLSTLKKSLPSKCHLVLVPLGISALLPFHMAQEPVMGEADGCSLILSYAPGASGVKVARSRAKEMARPSECLVVAEPAGAGVPLELARLEAQIVAEAMPFEGATYILEGEAASKQAVLEKLSTCQIAHFACHGKADLTQPLNSVLHLRWTEQLTPGDLLKGVFRFRLVVLSACESGAIGTHLPEEVIGFPTGWLQAGTAGVLATLWPVDDVASSLLVLRFYTLWLELSIPPAEALAQAREWLRNATKTEIFTFLEPFAGRTGGNPRHLLYHRLNTEIGLRGESEKIYASPYYWAAFTYTGW